MASSSQSLRFLFCFFLPLCFGSPKITVIMDKMAWLENLVLDPFSDSLFTSELTTGRVWKVYADSQGSYTQSLWISNFTRILGLTKDPSIPGMIYGVGEINNTNVVFNASSLVPQQYNIIATTPPDRIGNGFACHFTTGLLYTSSEGDFNPGTGSVYEINPSTGQVTTITGTTYTF